MIKLIDLIKEKRKKNFRIPSPFLISNLSFLDVKSPIFTFALENIIGIMPQYPFGFFLLNDV